MRKFLLLFNCILILILSNTGCTSQRNEPLKIATNNWVGYQPLYLANHLGYFNDASVSLIQMPSNTDVIRAFKNGLIDCASLTLDEAYLLLQDDLQIKVLFIMDVSDGADVLLSKSEIKSMHELKGKRVGVENTSVGGYVLARALDHANMKSSDIQIVKKLEAGNDDAFNFDKVDAVVTFEPTRSLLIKKGANILFDSHQIQNEIFDVFIVREDVYLKRTEEIKKIKETWFKTLAYMNTNPSRSMPYLCKRMGLTAEQLKQSMLGLKFPNLEENNKILKEHFIPAANKVLNIMLEERLLNKRVYPEQLIIKQ